ncbi:MAG TPA: hypothetical protein VJH24_05160 [Candidatus Bilamarchaeaceae archaeon]|nr:hypothetical protein [Candidatus Bilamarchaeaceae archaeon]
MPEDKLAKDSNIIGAVAYLNLFIAVIIYLIKKEDRFVKFHAMQAILLSLVWMAVFIVLWFIYFISFIGMFASFAVGFPIPLPFLLFPIIFLFVGLTFLLDLFLMYKSYKKERFKLPLIGNLAEKYSS